MITFSKDLAERVLSTFVQAFVGFITAAWAASGINVSVFTDLSAAEKLLGGAASAGVAAVVALVKGLAAKNVGENGTASLAPVDKAEPQYDLSGVETVDAA